MTPLEAKDEILAIFKTTWDDTGYTAVYDDQHGQPPDAKQPWARVTLQHDDNGGQTSLSNGVGNRIFTQTGLLTVQVFVPIADGLEQNYELSHRILSAYSPRQGASVWYTRQRLKEAKANGGFSQINVIINFSYDDLR